MSHDSRNSRLKEFLLLLRWRIRKLDRAQLKRWFYWIVRPASYPYISGDGFRRLADHVYDETWRRMQASRVRNGDVVFISTDRAERFFERVAPRIHADYSIITHNSDCPADEALVRRMPANVSSWFAQNNSYSAERVIPLPIGLENLHYYSSGIPDEFTMLRALAVAKKDRIFANFQIGTNVPERESAWRAAARASLVDCVPGRLPHRRFAMLLNQYKFAVSPPGNGLDTHRTWEAMYLGVVPIVKDSVAMRSFAALGLPLWIVRTWDELAALSESDLVKIYEELEQRFSAPALFADYWRSRIFEPLPSAVGGAETEAQRWKTDSSGVSVSASPGDQR